MRTIRLLPFPATKGTCILIVGGNQFVVEYLKACLLSAGLTHLAFAATGKAAVKFTRVVRPTMHIISAPLPDMSEADLYDQLCLNASPVFVPTVFLKRRAVFVKTEKGYTVVYLDTPLNSKESLATISALFTLAYTSSM